MASKARNNRPDNVTRNRIKATVLHLAKVLGESDGITYANCTACGIAAGTNEPMYSKTRFEFGHVVPDVEKGLWSPHNLVPICRKCNEMVGARDMEELMELRYDTRPLFQSELNGKLLPNPPLPTTGDDIPRVWLPPKPKRNRKAA